MSRTKKFFYNSLSTGMLQLVLLIINFILPKVILMNYGSEINGLTTSITQFISYFNLVEAGLAAAAVFSLYEPLANKNYKQINVVVSTAKDFYYKSGYIFTLLVILLSIFYPFFIQSNSMSYIEIFALVLVSGATGFLNFFTFAKYRVLLTADQKVYVISIASIVYNILNTIIIVVLANMGINIILVKFLAIFAIAMQSIIVAVYVKRKYKFINYDEKKDKKLLNKRWDALYQQILGGIQNGVPIILLTFFTDLVTVSIYSIYNMVLHGLSSILSIFTSGLSASFGDIIVRKDIKKLQSASEEFEYIYYNIITIVYAAAFVLIMPFISLYTHNITDVNYYVPLYGFLIVLNGVFYNLKTPQGMLVISAGMYKETRWQTTTQGLIIVILGAILTPILGVTGVLIACICSNVYRDIDWLFFIPKHLTHRTIWSTFKRQIKLFILGSISCIICFTFIKNIHGYFEWVIAGILSTLISTCIILIFDIFFEREQLKKMLLRLKILIGIK